MLVGHYGNTYTDFTFNDLIYRINKYVITYNRLYLLLILLIMTLLTTVNKKWARLFMSYALLARESFYIWIPILR